MKVDLDELAAITTAVIPMLESQRWGKVLAEFTAMVVLYTKDDGSNARADQRVARYIGANSPPVTLALIQRIRDLEKAFRAVTDNLNMPPALAADTARFLEQGAVIR